MYRPPNGTNHTRGPDWEGGLRLRYPGREEHDDVT